MLQGSSTSSSEMDASFQHVSIPAWISFSQLGPDEDVHALVFDYNESARTKNYSQTMLDLKQR